MSSQLCKDLESLELDARPTVPQDKVHPESWGTDATVGSESAGESGEAGRGAGEPLLALEGGTEDHDGVGRARLVLVSDLFGELLLCREASLLNFASSSLQKVGYWAL